MRRFFLPFFLPRPCRSKEQSRPRVELVAEAAVGAVAAARRAEEVEGALL